MVQQGPAFSAVCAFIVEKLHLTVSFLVAYSPNGLPFFRKELQCVVSGVWEMNKYVIIKMF
jgi:hypothetical protein